MESNSKKFADKYGFDISSLLSSTNQIELTEQEKKDILDFSKPFFYFTNSDIINMNDKGEFIIDGTTVESLGIFEKYIDILCRLKAVGYNKSPIDYDRDIGFHSDYQSQYEIMLKYLNLLKEIDKLKMLYGDNAYMHIDEIQNNQLHNEISDSIDCYNLLKENYQNYLQSLDIEDAKKLQTAVLIYNGVLFVPINEMSSIEGWKDKSSNELIELCEKSEDFKNIFHGKYQEFSKTLNDGYGVDYDIIKQYATILDFSSEETFMDSLKNVIYTIDEHKSKLTVPEDLLVYRGTASDEIPKDLSKGHIVSTSTSPKQAELFTNRHDKKYHLIHFILLRKGTPYIMPLTSQGESQKEIMLIKDSINVKNLGIAQIDRNSELTTYSCPVLYYEAEPIERQETIQMPTPKITGEDIGKAFSSEIKDVSARHNTQRVLDNERQNQMEGQNLNDK